MSDAVEALETIPGALVTRHTCKKCKLAAKAIRVHVPVLKQTAAVSICGCSPSLLRVAGEKQLYEPHAVVVERVRQLVAEGAAEGELAVVLAAWGDLRTPRAAQDGPLDGSGGPGGSGWAIPLHGDASGKESVRKSEPPTEPYSPPPSSRAFSVTLVRNTAPNGKLCKVHEYDPSSGRIVSRASALLTEGTATSRTFANICPETPRFTQLGDTQIYAPRF
jgi:hypothetical protein